MALSNQESASASALPSDDLELDKDPAQEISNISNVQTAGDAVLFLRSGLHKGASCPVGDNLVIGASLDSDLILNDEGIADSHVTMHLKETFSGFSVIVEALGDDVIINKRQPLASNEALTLTSSFYLNIGEDVEAYILVTRQNPLLTLYKRHIIPWLVHTHQKIKQLRKKISLASFFSDIRNVIVIFLLLAISIYGIIEITSITPYERVMKSIKNTPLPTYEPPSDYSTSRIAEKAIQDMNILLKKYNLWGRVALSTENSVIYAHGIINSYENTQWRKIQKWYDTNYAAKIPMIGLLKIRDQDNRRVSFKAVYTGEDAFVVSWTGERYSVGSILPEGWIIERIDDDGVRLQNQGRVMIVEPFQDHPGGIK